MLVHHTHKQKFGNDGKQLDEGDEALFGSKFLKAWADHTMLFVYDKKTEMRSLSCNTQRSGDIIKQCNLRLIEPDPLYFEATTKEPTKEFSICNLVNKYPEGLTSIEIMDRLNMGKNTFYSSIKKPITQGVLVKSGSRPIRYICKEV